MEKSPIVCLYLKLGLSSLISLRLQLGMIYCPLSFLILPSNEGNPLLVQKATRQARELCVEVFFLELKWKKDRSSHFGHEGSTISQDLNFSDFLVARLHIINLLVLVFSSFGLNVFFCSFNLPRTPVLSFSRLLTVCESLFSKKRSRLDNKPIPQLKKNVY